MLGQAQVNLLGGELLMPGLREQLAQHGFGRRGTRTLDAKFVAATPDLYAQARLHLPQVAVERPAQARQARIIGRFQGEFARRGAG
jgi:hypothetical protein